MSGTEPGKEKRREKRSVKKLIVRGSVWTVGGEGVGQALRLASNLVLTRLLVPDVFAVMVLVSTFQEGLKMFTDIGLQQNIVQSRRGEEPLFLDTAWTFRIIRGVLLWLVTCAIAFGLGAGVRYGFISGQNTYAHPDLRMVLPVTGLTAIIAGFKSTNLSLMSRNLRLGYTTLIDLSTTFIAMVVTVIWAWKSPTIWALVGGALASALLGCIASHVFIPGRPNRFAWDPSAVREFVKFGKWLFLGSVFTFLARRGDRFILGGLLTPVQFGVFTIANRLARFGTKIVAKISQSVLFPLYARLARDNLETLRPKLFRVRRLFVILTVPGLCLLSIFGPAIVRFLYTEPYHGAGQMLRILAIGGIGLCICLTSRPTLLAMGDSFRHMSVMIIRFLLMIGGMVIGGRIYGTMGVIGGIAAAELVFYVPLSLAVRRYGLWMPRLDLPAMLAAGVVIWVGVLIFP